MRDIGGPASAETWRNEGRAFDADVATVCDPRITEDFNKNGLLDAEDLIHAFSDGHDDDGNGYIDDISGWDFFHNDNDPSDDTRFGHGTGEAAPQASGAENDERDGYGAAEETPSTSAIHGS